MQAFTAGADALHLANRPLPKSPDGHYDWQNQADSSASPQAHAGVTNLVNTIKSLKPKDPINVDPGKVHAFVDAALHPGSLDDRTNIFSYGIELLSQIPPNSDLTQKLSSAAVSLLYKTVPHPPAAFLGPVHSFREADGGGNNLQSPELGRSGMPYARSVQGKACIEPSTLPDPGVVFDTLMKAARNRRIHPGGNSSMTFAFASLVTHSIFKTDENDMNINSTSSYLDLSPLYGFNQAKQDLVRNKALGRGLLYPDAFSEDRIVFLPPATSALLVLLSRNHNYIATMLLKINEQGRWTDPPPPAEDPPAANDRRAQQDQEIFQTAKLINCGHFMSLILNDYVGGFLGLSEGLESSLLKNAFNPIKTKDGLEVERGLGNHCSVEFNVLYRWHPTLSVADEQWTNGIVNKVFNNKPFDQVGVKDLREAFPRLRDSVDPDPATRPFGGLERGPDGKFSDDDIARVLLDATESPAGAFGARNTPPSLRVIEIMGIMQARKWGVCTMNEFREYLGLKRFDDFEEWNPDPEIASAARRLYQHIDNLELYTGLHCEATMPLSPGVRFSSGFTVMRAILGDAIALIRGDRFYTTDFTPANLTVWGYQSCQRDLHNGGGGAQLPTLLLRHLPRHYPFNSVYACYPLFTPQKMKQSLTAQGVAQKYTFDRPVSTPPVKILNTFTGIKKVFNDPARFRTFYHDLEGVGSGYGFFLCFDDPAKHSKDRAWALHALFPSANSLTEYREWYRDSAIQKIKEKSWKYDGVAGNYIDITKSVINSTSIDWAAVRLCGLPLKTKENPKGLFTEQEIYDMFGLLTYDSDMNFLVISNNEHSFAIRSAALEVADMIQGLIEKSILEVAPHIAPNMLAGLVANVKKYVWPPGDKPCHLFLSRLAESGRPINELIGAVISLAVGSCLDMAQASVQVLDFYLDDERKNERLEILNLAKRMMFSLLICCADMFEKPCFTTILREAAVDAVIPQGPGLPPMEVKAGEHIGSCFKNAHLNPADFPNPTAVDPTRLTSSYNLNGTGFHGCPGVDYAVQTITETLKVVFKLKNVRRAPGNAGKMRKFKMVINGGETNIYLTPYGTTTPWPSSMHLVYDD
ncbi:heme peroxidase [Mycena rebaudengoi]|nr:heme peroxidase [Mycena rebaudengoi]